MANNKSSVLFLLLLAFLFLLTAPLVLIFGHNSSLLQLPQFVTYHNVSIAATAGLFIIPVLFVYLAAVIVALKKGSHAKISSVAVAKVAVAKKRVTVRYAWESVFRPEKEPVPVKLRTIPKNPATPNSRAIAAVVIALAVIGLIILVSVTPSLSNAFGRGHNETKYANITQPAVQPAVAPNNVSKAVSSKTPAANASSSANASKENAFSRFLSAVSKIQPPQEPAKPLVKEEKQASEVASKGNAVSPILKIKKSFAPAKSFGSKVKKVFLNSIRRLKAAILKVSNHVWQKIAVSAVALLLVAAVFYSHKTNQLGGIPKWFNGWFDRLAAILAAVRRNIWKTVGVVIAVAVIGWVIAAAVFGKWLSASGINAKLPTMSSLPNSLFDALIAARNFISVYRLYIIIGIFAFLIIIGILFAFEKKGKNKLLP